MLTNNSLEVPGILIQQKVKHTFAFWLKMQARRKDTIGDLARDLKADHTGRRLKNFESVEMHLMAVGACQGEMKALERAGIEFQKGEIHVSRQTKKITLEEYEMLGEQFNELIDKIVHLNVDVLNFIGKTKAQKKANQLIKARNMISEIRYDIENEMLVEISTAPLITSFRKYRGNKVVTDADKTKKLGVSE